MAIMTDIVKQLKKERDRVAKQLLGFECRAFRLHRRVHRNQTTETAQAVSKIKGKDRSRAEEAMGCLEGEEEERRLKQMGLAGTSSMFFNSFFQFVN